MPVSEDDLDRMFTLVFTLVAPVQLQVHNAPHVAKQLLHICLRHGGL